jgi:hypothetical protein
MHEIEVDTAVASAATEEPAITEEPTPVVME